MIIKANELTAVNVDYLVEQLNKEFKTYQLGPKDVDSTATAAKQVNDGTIEFTAEFGQMTLQVVCTENAASFGYYDQDGWTDLLFGAVEADQQDFEERFANACAAAYHDIW